jgi:hypothetical protein
MARYIQEESCIFVFYILYYILLRLASIPRDTSPMSIHQLRISISVLLPASPLPVPGNMEGLPGTMWETNRSPILPNRNDVPSQMGFKGEPPFTSKHHKFESESPTQPNMVSHQAWAQARRVPKWDLQDFQTGSCPQETTSSGDSPTACSYNPAPLCPSTSSSRLLP